MSAWVVRAGFAKTGDFESIAFGRNVAVINFGLHGNVSDFPTQQELRGHLLAHAPDWYGYDSARKAGYAAAQLWKFANDIAVGDMVLIPNSRRRVVAVGRVNQGPVRHIHVKKIPRLLPGAPRGLESKRHPNAAFRQRPDPRVGRTPNGISTQGP